MRRPEQLSSPGETAAPDCSGLVGIPTIEECQRFDAPLRDDLELLDYEIRRRFNRILAGVDQSGQDSVLFLKASTTVLLSIAAGVMESTAERTRQPFDVASFKAVAENAAKWAKNRKVKYFVAGEG
ncbi:MAG: hypothetical protein HYS06_02135 [Methylocystis sp.]|nr:hypothetical protein [Methylocystis sp.]